VTRKFLAGVAEHQRLWPGPVQVIMEPAANLSDNLDNVEIKLTDLPFDLFLMSPTDPRIKNILQGASLVLLILYQRHFRLAAVCKILNVPAIYISEYSLNTRMQIVDVSTSNLLKRYAKLALEAFREIQARKTVSSTAGLQCNGTPTYDAYCALSPSPMLFFDTRIVDAKLPDQQTLERRFLNRRRGGKLRLAFSGRLIQMKGVDHLPAIANALHKRGCLFGLSICGSGILEKQMRQEVDKLGLAELVKFRGNLDFETELVPFIRDDVDLFVCCHRQGDPSCTYMETMSCGVPIIGYANEALTGLVAKSSVGWTTPLDDPDALAARIASLSSDEIETQSIEALQFARAHTLEKEFERRMAHAREVARVG
jgi:colanic acid/amylovoran biosynthesis glycosyltransferase